MGVRRPWLVLAVLLIPAGARASDHKFDLYVAASYLNAEGLSHLGGWHFAAAATLKDQPKLSFIGDFSIHFVGGDGDPTQITFLTGPRWTFLRGENQHHMPFVHAVVLGVVHRSGSSHAGGASAGAIAIGVGYDLAPGKDKIWGTRLQVDYLRPVSSSMGDGWRFSLGGVYRFKHH